jgi:hypothetical protein
MNRQTRLIAETRLGEDPENTIFLSGRLHNSATGRCICEKYLVLEAAIGSVAELLRPGESRQIGIEDSPLFLIVKRHRFPPSAGRVKCHRLAAVDERSNAIASRGRGFILLRR